MHISTILVVAVAVIFQTVILTHPGHRVCNWFEFFTDGMMPSAFANSAQDALARLWVDGFNSGAVQHDKQVTNAIASCLRKSSNLIIEIAAGGGVVSSLWAKELRSRHHSTARINILLTDIQPNPSAWSRLVNTVESVDIQYVNSSVDATNLELSLSNTSFKSDGGITRGSFRMINLALHHFPPSLVRSIFSDVIRSHSSLLVGDLAPNAGNVLWTLARQIKSMLLSRSSKGQKKENNSKKDSFLSAGFPMWAPLAVPFLPLMAWHDGVVSVLRAYSAQELQDVMRSIPGSERYDIKVYYSGSQAEWLELPIACQHIPFSGLSDPVLQYVLIEPLE